MRVAVFRARDDGLRTAERLRGLGHDPVLAPVFDVVPTGEPVPAGPFAAVIFTSAHGVTSPEPTDLRGLLALPCFCVGRRTAECAEQAGFVNRHSGRADAEHLADLVRTRLGQPAHILLIAGRDRKPAIEMRLAAAGFRVLVAEVYEAKARMHWLQAERAALASASLDGALHYSRRSTALALACAEAAGLTPALVPAYHCCLSADAADPLIEAGCRHIAIAPEPNEDSLLATLDRI